MLSSAAGAAGAVGAAGAAGGIGLGLFGYNRGNYLYDAGFRFERFNAGREFAIEQMDQYREDLRKLSELTAKKCGMYSIFASLGMALCVALYCAGRLGLHGPSPPMHVMGLWLTNNAAAFAYYVVTIWLSVHACYRASASSTQLLTRKARVPVPTLRQLDKARKFASEFEQQDWSDIFRVPYINNPGVPVREEPAERASSEPPQRRRNKESSWARDEFDTDKAGSVVGPDAKGSPHLSDTAPEHFQLYTKVQKHWIQYDIYARVSLLYGYLSFVHSLAYYGLGHINVELRAWWVAYATPFVITTLLCLLIKFDIVTNKEDQNSWYSVTIWFGPAAVLPAAIAMSLDFRVEFDMTAIAFTWIFVFTAYILQFIYTLRLFWILMPEKDPQPDDRVGDPWWPDGWMLPTRFQHVLYMVAPPQRLKPGQNDIVREIKEGHLDPALSSKGAATKDDVEIQVRHLDQAFSWFFDEGILNKFTPDKQAKINEIYKEYCHKRKAWQDNKSKEYTALAETIYICIDRLESIRKSEPSLEEFGSIGVADLSDADQSDGENVGHDVRYTQRKAPPLFSQTDYIQPHRAVMMLTGVLVFSWFFLIAGNIVDCVTGEQGTVTAPHWSRPPMTRLSYVPHDLGTPMGFPWPASSRPYYPENMRWHEEKRIATADTIFHAGGYAQEGPDPTHHEPGGHRRLHEITGPAVGGFGVQGHALKEAVEGLMEVLPKQSDLKRKAESISWPGFFEPRLLACGPAEQDGAGVVAALTQRGFGAVARLAGGGMAAESFKLAGLSHLPPFVGVSWGADGLTLVSRAGDLAACPGRRPAPGGAWACGPPKHAPLRLPMQEGTKLLAATAAMLNGPGGTGGEPRLHAAVVHESTPDLVVLFHLQDMTWLPLGEVPVPAHGGGAITDEGRVSLSISPSGDLTVATATGGVVQRRLRDGMIIGSTSPGKMQQTWQGTCGCHSTGRMAHLHLQKVGPARRPEIVLSDSFDGSSNDAVLYP